MPFDLNLKDHRIIECYANPQQLDGKSVGVVFNFRDVTLQRQSEAIMHRQAAYDFLTGLPNRMQFNDIINTALQSNIENFLALMFLDLDNFKQVNDTLGHAMGDLLLQQTSKKLKKCIRDVDFLARWGGDEFVILLRNIQSRLTVDDIASRLISTLQQEYNLSCNFSNVTISIGIAIFPQDGNNSATLLECADQALYQAKKAGKNNYCYYSDPVFDKFA